MLARLEVAKTQVAADVLSTHIVWAVMLFQPGQGAEEEGLRGSVVAFEDFEGTEVVDSFEGVSVFRAASSLSAFESLLKEFFCGVKASFFHVRDR